MGKLVKTTGDVVRRMRPRVNPRAAKGKHHPNVCQQLQGSIYSQPYGLREPGRIGQEPRKLGPFHWKRVKALAKPKHPCLSAVKGSEERSFRGGGRWWLVRQTTDGHTRKRRWLGAGRLKMAAEVVWNRHTTKGKSLRDWIQGGKEKTFSRQGGEGDKSRTGGISDVLVCLARSGEGEAENRGHVQLPKTRHLCVQK